MWSRIREIVRKEFFQALRHPRMRIALIGPPLVQLVIFGYAVSLDVDHIGMGWMDEDRTPASLELLAAYRGSGRFELHRVAETESEVQQLLDRGDVQVVIRVPRGLSRDIQRNRPAAVQILIDGTNSNTAELISGYAAEVANNYSAQLAGNQQTRDIMARVGMGSMNLHAPKLETRTRVWFNADLRSRNYYVPGVVVNIVMIVTVMLTSMAIVREKEIGTMEQLMVTPIRPIELMIGKTLPFAGVGLLDMVLTTSVALLLFGIPFRGSPLLLALAAIPFLLTCLGTGLLVSTISRTQQQALMSSFFFAIPAFMLSGFVFPIRNMPIAVQYMTYLNPLRYFMEIVRSIFLKGTGLSVLWPQLLALVAYGVSMILLSAARFRKRLE
jgi:ABC-2 type transport system permease protein